MRSKPAMSGPSTNRATGESAKGNQRQDRPKAKSEVVVETLLDKITGGELSPGQKLPSERSLAEQMGVSRVSVRAALERLKAQGFVTAVQGGGTSVVSSAPAMEDALSVMISRKQDNLYDLAEIRMSLETWAARRAAERATKQDINRIAQALDRMRKVNGTGRGEKDDKAQADMAFHYAVAGAAHSPVYQHMLAVVRETLVAMLEFHRFRLFGTPEDDETILTQHEAIYRAIANRDPARAQQAMQDHLSWVLVHYRDEPPRSPG